MIADATANSSHLPPVMPNCASTASTRSSTTHVLTPTHPIVRTNCTTPGTFDPLRPNAARPSTIWFTAVRWPITLNTPKTAQPMMFPNTTTAMVSTRLSPNVMPSAPSTQLIGAMLAPDQIQNSSHGEQSRLSFGIASMPCASNGTAVDAAGVGADCFGLVDIVISSLGCDWGHRNTTAGPAGVYKHP